MDFFQKMRQWRKKSISAPILRAFQKVMPPMSATEKEAIEAGTVWWDAELFSGRPDWQKLMRHPAPVLSAEEQSFMDNEVEQACAMVDDWQVSTRDFDLSPETWQYIREKRFLGMIIPKQYGGLGFSAFAHSEVIAKLSSRNSALAVSVMVPNSLGPGELLLHYGTAEQKDHYLPRLASGQEIPAFALTSPWAGSDAAAIPDSATVCKGTWEGKEVLGMRVNWDKRYITLAPVCTLLGLAFRLYDPDGLLGDKKDIGITCALVPANHPGVKTGRRHFPLNAMFMNGPTRGKDVFMPLSFIIGGPDMAGQGWRMLMECLATGRAISLPSANVGISQLSIRTVGAYCRIRKQFNLSIGHFEGIETVLSRMAAHTYASNAVRMLTASAIDIGEKPSVISSIAKCHVTERSRQTINDAMDIIGGKGICLGPSNFMGRAYQQLPIGITVEGANILTRSLIIFGQGAIRCHPYILKEMEAAQETDFSVALEKFDALLWRHIGFGCRNGLRTFFSSLLGSRLLRLNSGCAPETRLYLKQISRLSSALAFMSDITLLSLG
ncbi:MAG: acyl-CoA dehydrogenase, partial [Alcaligenaceae bacterium]|nr:acyl-CoA dehydrogenase [Alcaligenaceae bacterium]